MPTVHFTNAQGATTTINANTGDTVMESAVRNGITAIVAECGGSLSCATCHVFVSEADLHSLEPMGEMEDEMLYGTAEDREANSRLSCQIRLGESQELRVTTPETQV